MYSNGPFSTNSCANTICSSMVPRIDRPSRNATCACLTSPSGIDKINTTIDSGIVTNLTNHSSAIKPATSRDGCQTASLRSIAAAQPELKKISAKSNTRAANNVCCKPGNKYRDNNYYCYNYRRQITQEQYTIKYVKYNMCYHGIVYSTDKCV